MSRNYWEKRHWIPTLRTDKGRSGSCSVNYQQTGKGTLTPDEIRLLDNQKRFCLFIKERPIMDDKYDLKKHYVNFRYTEDGGASLLADYEKHHWLPRRPKD